MENLELALIVLLAGVVIVFTILVLLIFIIKIFGISVTKLEEKMKSKKEIKLQSLQETVVKEVEAPQPVSVKESSGVSGQVIAVIAAAVDSMYGEGNCKIKAIKKLPPSRSAWNVAGLMDNTRPF